MRALLILAVSAACRATPAPAPAPAPGNADSSPGVSGVALTTPAVAIAAFTAAWDREVRPTIAGHRDPLIAAIDATMRTPEAAARYSAELLPCAEGRRAIEELSRATGYDYVLHGAMTVAHARARCWLVRYVCCMKGDAEALLDPTTGALLVVWRVPEG